MSTINALQIEMWTLDRVRPYENNPRNNDKAVDAVAASIKEFGFSQPIVVDTDSVIIVGHNPGMGELVSMLVHQAHDGSKLARDFSGHFPTSAFAAFEIKGDLLRAAGPRLVAAWKPPRDRDDD